MARGDNDQITRDYLAKKPLQKSLTTVVGRNNGGWYGGGPMYAQAGTRRYWYDDDQLYSYNMPLICRVKVGQKDFYILNGDGPPSMKTSEHQGILRRIVDQRLLRSDWAIIPYSALDRAGVRPQDIELVATTPDRTTHGWRVCRTGKCWALRSPNRESDSELRWHDDGDVHDHRTTHHFLGETLFRVKTGNRYTYYVSGLDRNDNPDRRMYYLAELPRAAKNPKTVDEALELLRPKSLSDKTPRQGEWFFDPVPFNAAKMKPEEWRKYLKLKKTDTLEVRSEKTTYKKFEGKAESRMERESRQFHHHYASLDERSSGRRHYAPELLHVVVNAGDPERRQHIRFARGTIRDAEHDPLKLAPGWHRAVVNRSVRSWRAGGASGARVD